MKAQKKHNILKRTQRKHQKSKKKNFKTAKLNEIQLFFGGISWILLAAGWNRSFLMIGMIWRFRCSIMFCDQELKYFAFLGAYWLFCFFGIMGKLFNGGLRILLTVLNNILCPFGQFPVINILSSLKPSVSVSKLSRK